MAALAALTVGAVVVEHLQLAALHIRAVPEVTAQLGATVLHTQEGEVVQQILPEALAALAVAALAVATVALLAAVVLAAEVEQEAHPLLEALAALAS
jgi:hypothetical protein